jgi:hypothetical protein
MFRCVDVCLLAILFVIVPIPSHAQSIGDYSRTQRAAIESAIARSGVRPPVELPSLPSPQGPTGGGASNPALPPPSPPPITRPVEPVPEDIAVTGVIISPAVVLTEVVVDGIPFLLSLGQRVPGTRWLVNRVDADRVILSEEPRRRGAKPVSRTFLLASSGS